MPEFSRFTVRTAVAAARVLSQIEPAIYVNINFTAQEFSDPTLAERLVRACRQAGVSPRHVRAEVTETTLLELGNQTRECVARLASAGIRCALDDFGAGFSNFSYLAQVRGADLKIDGGFVRAALNNERAAYVCRTVVQTARALEVKAVAEQVETREQARALAELGCHIHQGHYYARPGVLEDVVALLRQPPPHWKVIDEPAHDAAVQPEG